MLNENLNMELISEITGLSEKEVIKIKELWLSEIEWGVKK